MTTSLRVLYDADTIASRVREVARQVDQDYASGELVMVGILKGAAFVLADLARAVTIPVDFEFVDVTSSLGERGEVVHLTYATHFSLANRHVLVIKDVLHSGVTENYLMTHLSQQRPASVEVLALVDKPQLRSVNLAARYALFSEVPDGTLVGYGLSHRGQQHVNRRDLCLLTEQ